MQYNKKLAERECVKSTHLDVEQLSFKGRHIGNLGLYSFITHTFLTSYTDLIFLIQQHTKSTPLLPKTVTYCSMTLFLPVIITASPTLYNLSNC
jgi:hypothetical protein